MRWSTGGLMEPTCVLEAATFHRSILVACSCGHSGRFEAHGLWWHFERRGWDDALSAASRRFWCRKCASHLRRKVRPEKVETVPWSEGDFELPWPDERTWKKAVSRLR